MADYEGQDTIVNGLTRTQELENTLQEILDLWDQGLLQMPEDADLDEVQHIASVMDRAFITLEEDLDVELDSDD